MSYFNHVEDAANFMRAVGCEGIDTAIVLGSGLGAFADGLTDAIATSYKDIPHWPASAVIGHEGKVVAGQSRSRRVVALSGRAHFYEGHDLKTVTFAIRALGRLKAERRS